MTQTLVQSNVNAAFETLQSSPDFRQIDAETLILRCIDLLREFNSEAGEACNLTTEEEAQLAQNSYWLHCTAESLEYVRRAGKFLADK